MERRESPPDEAVDFHHLKTDVPFHRALDDAGYTAAIMEVDFEKVGPYVPRTITECRKITRSSCWNLLHEIWDPRL